MAEKGFIQFLKWSSLYEKERPFQIFTNVLPNSPDQRKTNLLWDQKQVELEDFREKAIEFELDTHGFTTRCLPGFDDLLDKETAVSRYLSAIEKMLQDKLDDVGTVFIFDWRIRTSRPAATETRINFSDQTQPLLPSNYAHIDAGPTSILQRIENSFPSCAREIMRQRIRAVNVWKPLCNPVEEWPLAVCDGTTVKPEDLVETDSVRQGSVSTNYYVKYAPEQRWYYLKNQTPEETLIFKHFDSEPRVQAPYALHSSVQLAHPPVTVNPRWSIEVRTLIFSGTFPLG